MKSPQTDEVASKFRKVKRREEKLEGDKVCAVGVSAYGAEPKRSHPFSSVTQSPGVVWAGVCREWRGNNWLPTHL